MVYSFPFAAFSNKTGKTIHNHQSALRKMTSLIFIDRNNNTQDDQVLPGFNYAISLNI